jgi:hypothetical protein
LHGFAGSLAIASMLRILTGIIIAAKANVVKTLLVLVFIVQIIRWFKNRD